MCGERRNITSPVKRVGSGNVIGEFFGDGSPRVLALHGWGRSHIDFAGVLEGFDGLAIDLPGFGASPEPETAGGAGEYADWIASVLDELDPPVVTIGHSFGGRVALLLAARFPDKVGALVLTGVPLLRLDSRMPKKPALRFRLLRKMNEIGVVSDEQMERVRRRYGSDDYRAARGVMREVLVKVVNESYEKDIEQVRCPVELVWGGNDSTVPVVVAESAMNLFANARLTVVDNCGHETLTGARDQLQSALARQLAALDR